MIEQNLSYHNTPDKEKKDIRDAWMKAIARTVLPKAETYITRKPQLFQKVSC